MRSRRTDGAATDGAAADGAGEPASASVESLFVVQGESGSATADDGSQQTWVVDLHVPTARMLEFTDRPARDAAHIDVTSFVDSWEANGFVDDPPNATLVGTTDDGVSIAAPVELTDPTWEEAASVLRVRATPIGDFNAPPAPGSMTGVSLFIDDADAYRSVTIRVLNSTDGEITVEGFEAIQGEWGRDGTPSAGAVIGSQSAVNFVIESNEVGVGVEASIQFASDDGEFAATVHAPWNGPPAASVSKPDGSSVEVLNGGHTLRMADPDHPFWPITFVTSPGAAAK